MMSNQNTDDHYRVMLRATAGQDYINASFINVRIKHLTVITINKDMPLYCIIACTDMRTGLHET